MLSASISVYLPVYDVNCFTYVFCFDDTDLCDLILPT